MNATFMRFIAALILGAAYVFTGVADAQPQGVMYVYKQGNPALNANAWFTRMEIVPNNFQFSPTVTISAFKYRMVTPTRQCTGQNLGAVPAGVNAIEFPNSNTWTQIFTPGTPAGAGPAFGPMPVSPGFGLPTGYAVIFTIPDNQSVSCTGDAGNVPAPITQVTTLIGTTELVRSFTTSELRPLAVGANANYGIQLTSTTANTSSCTGVNSSGMGSVGSLQTNAYNGTTRLFGWPTNGTSLLEVVSVNGTNQWVLHVPTETVPECTIGTLIDTLFSSGFE